jgi:hypothetical protein
MMTKKISAEFSLLQRESFLIRANIYSGLEALRKSTTFKKSYYYQAFFSLSVGIERLGKLIIILDQHPNKVELKTYSHNLVGIVNLLTALEEKWEIVNQNELDCEIQKSIIDCLDAFAMGERYFYLDFFSSKNKTALHQKNSIDPLVRWHLNVSEKILQKHKKNIGTVSWDYESLAKDLKEFISVFQTDELDNEMTITQILENKSEKINKYCVWYTVKILVRMVNALTKISDYHIACKSLACPCFFEFFSELYMDKSAILKKKIWLR